MPSRLALAFGKAGCQVSAVFPRGNPLRKLTLLKKQFRYSPVHPLAALKEAIELSEATLIIPCDDRVVEHLHRLHTQNAASSQSPKLAKVIEDSLGAPRGYSVTCKRWETLALAKGLGILIPETGVVRGLAELKHWCREHGFPSILKADGTWGGTGVRVVRSLEQAEEAFVALTRPLSCNDILKQISMHDFYPLFAQPEPRPAEVVAQRYIEGSAANAMFACADGQVLDELTVKVLLSIYELGSATIVRTMENAQIADAGRKLVQALGIAGFCGLDFILEAGTGRPYLIEMNPRATQLGHLEPGGQPSLVETISRRLAGEPGSPGRRSGEETIALFPQLLRCKPEDPLLAANHVHYDVPWQEPELIQELMRKPWNSRHLSARLYAVTRFF